MASIADAYVDLHINGDRISGEIRRAVKKAEPDFVRDAGKVGDKAGLELGQSLEKRLSKIKPIEWKSGPPFGAGWSKQIQQAVKLREREATQAVKLRERAEAQAIKSFERETKAFEREAAKALKIRERASAQALKIREREEAQSLKIRKRAEALASKSFSRTGAGNDGGLSSRAKLWTAIGASAVATSPHILVLAGSLLEVAKVGALLPAAIGAAGASIATLAVGFKGFGQALKDMDDPKKFAESLKNLAPNAQAAAKAIKSIVPEWSNLRKQVQNDLFAGFAKNIRTLSSTYLPVLRKGMRGVATQFSAGFGILAKGLQQTDTVSSIGTIFKNTAKSLEPFFAGLTSIIRALIKVADVGSSFLPGLALSFEKIGAQFKAFIDEASASGALQQFIQDGIDATKQLFSALFSVWRILNGIFKAAQAAGGGGLASLASVLGKVADAINSPAFQEGLTAFFYGLDKGLEGVLSALPAIADLFGELGKQLGPLLEKLGPILGDALIGLAGIIKPLLAPVAELIGKILDAAAPLIDALKTTLPPLAEAVAKIIKGFADQIDPSVYVTIGNALKVVIPLLTKLLDLIGPTIGKLLAFMTPFGQAVLIVKLYGAAFEWITNTVIPALGLAWDWLKDKFISAVTWVADTFNSIRDSVQNFWTDIQDGFSRVGESISGGLSSVWSAVTGFFYDLSVAVGEFAIRWIQRAQEAAQGFVRGFTQPLTDAVATVKRIGGDIVQGLVDGIRGGFKWVEDAARELTDHIPGPVKDILRIGSPSKLMEEYGHNVGDGLAIGMDNSQGVVATAAENLALASIQQLQATFAANQRLINDLLNTSTNPEGLTMSRGAIAQSTRLAKENKAIQAAIRARATRPSSYTPRYSGGGGGGGSGGRGSSRSSGPSAAQTAADKRKKTLLEIAQDLGRSMVLSLTGTEKQVAAAITRLNKLVIKGFTTKLGTKKGTAAAEAFIKRNNSLTKKLLKSARDRAAALDAYNKYKKETVDPLHKLVDKTKDDLLQFGSITTIEDAATATTSSLIENLNSRLQKIKDFGQSLLALKKAGLRKEVLEEIIAAGPEAGNQLALQLLAGGQGVIKEVNQVTAQIATNAGSVADQAGQAMFGVGVAAADGILAGLKSRSDRLSKAATELANQLIRAVKKALGIHSPSVIMAAQGDMAVAGFVNSITAGQRAVAAAGRALGYAVPAIGRAGSGGLQAIPRTSTVNNGPMTVNMTVSVDDLNKMSQVGDFMVMLQNARMNQRRQIGTVNG